MAFLGRVLVRKVSVGPAAKTTPSLNPIMDVPAIQELPKTRSKRGFHTFPALRVPIDRLA